MVVVVLERDNFIVIAWSVSPIYIITVGTPCKRNIKFVVIRTCFMGDTTSITFVLLPAGFRMSHHKIGVFPT